MEEAKEFEEEEAKASEEEGAKESDEEEAKKSDEEAKDPPEDEVYLWNYGMDAANLPGAALPHPFFYATEDEGIVKQKQQKERLADEYVRLSLQFESALIQHKLALEYFEFRSFYFVFLPVTIIATLITIIGFLVSGSGTTQNDDGASDGSVEFDPLLTGNSKQKWSLVVGILGAISTLLNAIGKRTNYQSQSDMHRSAVKALEKICLTLDFERDWFDRNVRDIECAGYEELTTKLGADLKTHQASFKAMIDVCCDSPVPYQVDQAFTFLEQIVFQQVLGHDIRGFARALSPLMFYYHKLWMMYSTHWLWPLKAPSVTVPKKYKEWKQTMMPMMKSDRHAVAAAAAAPILASAANHAHSLVVVLGPGVIHRLR